MNIKFFLLSLLLLLVPACRKSPRYAAAPVIRKAVPKRPSMMKNWEHLSLKKMKTNLMLYAASQAQQEEELTAATSEPTSGDVYKDSAQYGLKRSSLNMIDGESMI